MPVYHGKLLELLAVDTEDNQSFLRIKLSFEEDIELLWRIDHDTAASLKTVASFEQSHKYRLSFSSSWDVTKNQYVSSLTRTYRDQSEKIYFSCSESYVNSLHTIKSSDQSSHIHALPFLSSQLQPITHVKQRKAPTATRFYRKFSWAAVAMLVITSTILLGYFPMMNNTEFIKNISVKAKETDNEIPVDLMPRCKQQTSVE